MDTNCPTAIASRFCVYEDQDKFQGDLFSVDDRLRFPSLIIVRDLYTFGLQ